MMPFSGFTKASRLGWLGAAALAAVIVACGPSEEQKRAEEAVKEPGAAEPAKVVFHRGNSAEPSTLDPHRASGTWENNIIGDLFMGLMTENAEGEPVAGAAASWETSDDGLVWTFTLREHTWSDGVPVTAEDFAYAYRRILEPETAARYASILYPIKNARAVNSGETDSDQLGVRAVDERTFQITLEYPAPFLPQMLTHYTTYPVPKHAVEQHGDNWVQPENIVTNGAYVLAEWRPNDYIRTVKNPSFFDAGNVKIDEIYFYPTDDRAAALRRYRAGELDMNDDFPIGQYQDLKQKFGDEVKSSVFLETDYLAVNLEKEQFKGKPGVRRALGLAIDRRILVNKVRRLEETPAFSFVPPVIANYVDGAVVTYKDEDMEARREEARRLLAEAGYGPDNPLKFELRYRSNATDPKTTITLQAMWKEVGIEASLVNTEPKTHYDDVESGRFEVALVGWVADYNDPKNFLFLLRSDSGKLNYPNYNNPKYDQLLDDADQEADVAERARILSQAEKIILADAPVIPLVHQNTRSVVGDHVTGFIPNPVDINRTRWLGIDESKRD